MGLERLALVYLIVITSTTIVILLYERAEFRLLNLQTSVNYQRTNISDAILFYRAYLDNRTGSAQLRVLVLSKCFKKNAVVSIEANGLPVGRLKALSMEGGCPWGWAPKCKWGPFFLESNIASATPEEATLSFNGRTLQVPVHVAEKELKDKIQVCVAPLYWFDDWPRLILFFELWLREKATFIIYANSVSKNVKTVLDFYSQMGALQILEWPLFPKLATEDPNSSTYRLSQTLAQNDCVLRADSRFVASLDIDEFLFTHNSSLLEYARSVVKKNPKVGSLRFQHNAFGADMSSLDGLFKNIAGAKAMKNQRPSKVILLPDRTRQLGVHQVDKHVPSFKQFEVPRSSGFLLHYRLGLGNATEKNSVPFGARSPFIEPFSQHLREVARMAFNGDPPPYHSPNSSGMALGQCLSKWHSVGCQLPMTGKCWDKLAGTNDWHFYQGNDLSKFTVF